MNKQAGAIFAVVAVAVAAVALWFGVLRDQGAGDDPVALAVPDLMRIATLELARAAVNDQPPSVAEAAFDRTAAEMLAGTEKPYSFDRDLSNFLGFAIGNYFYQVEKRAKENPRWPAGRTPERWLALSLVKLELLKGRINDILIEHGDPLPLLREANRIWGWTQGIDGPLPAHLDHFAARDALVMRAAPLIVGPTPTRDGGPPRLSFPEPSNAPAQPEILPPQPEVPTPSESQPRSPEVPPLQPDAPSQDEPPPHKT